MTNLIRKLERATILFFSKTDDIKPRAALWNPMLIRVDNLEVEIVVIGLGDLINDPREIVRHYIFQHKERWTNLNDSPHNEVSDSAPWISRALTASRCGVRCAREACTVYVHIFDSGVVAILDVLPELLWLKVGGHKLPGMCIDLACSDVLKPSSKAQQRKHKGLHPCTVCQDTDRPAPALTTASHFVLSRTWRQIL